IEARGLTMHFRVAGRALDGLEVTVNHPGRHNVLNALAAIGVAREVGVAPAAIVRALAEFSGLDRRFQVNGRRRFVAGAPGPVGGGDGVLVDDYGHHPREVAATSAAARAVWPERRLVVAFQPHRYTRTRDLLDDFSAVLSEVDVLLLTEVYPAGEKPIRGADGRALARAIRARGRIDPIFVADVQQLPAQLAAVARANDVLLTLGAGNIGQIAAALPAALQSRRAG